MADQPDVEAMQAQMARLQLENNRLLRRRGRDSDSGDSDSDSDFDSSDSSPGDSSSDGSVFDDFDDNSNASYGAPAVGNNVGRLNVRLDPPKPEKYTGDKSQRSRLAVKMWMLSLLTYFTFYPGMSSAQQVAMAGQYLAGSALAAYLSHKAIHGDFTSIKKLYRWLMRTHVPATEEAIVRNHLNNCKQRGSAEDYNAAFNKLVARLPSRARKERGLLHTYLAGLKGPVGEKTATANPKSLRKAQAIAVNFDTYEWMYNAPRSGNNNQSNKHSRHNNRYNNNRNNNRDGPTPMELGAIDMTDRERLMRENRCFKCGEIGHRARDNVCKRTGGRPNFNNTYNRQNRTATNNVIEQASTSEAPN